MGLTEKEQTIALIASAIAIYSKKREGNDLPENVSLIDFILKTIPENLKKEVSMDLVDDVFEFVSSAHSS